MRRVIFYLFYDSRGQVDDYITHKLAALREHAEHIFVVSNSDLTEEGRARLESVADTVWQRRNVGFDVWAYKEAMEKFGWDRLVEYDEAILMNYTFFGPVYPFSETFDRMAYSEVDFWGLTAHKEVQAAPFNGGPFHLPLHIQSHWIAIRQPMLGSTEFRRYWDDMPPIVSYDDSVLKHEARFTEHFANLGFTYEVAFPPENYPTDHPVFDSATLLLEDRCPIVKRRLFFHDPLYLERNAIIGKRLIDLIEKAGYSTDLIWPNVARTAEPRTLYTNFSLLDIFAPNAVAEPAPVHPRIAVIAHIYYDEMVDELMSYVGNIPAPYDLIVTTPSQQKADRIAELLAPYDIASFDIRVVDNRGRDMAALLVGCRDILLSDEYDLVCRIHSKKSPQDAFNASNLFKHHLLDNLLCSPSYVSQIIAAFAKDESLGMMFPPVVNISYPTMGHSWFLNREPAAKVAKELGLTVPFDKTTPLAPYGSMFWFRPRALRRMAAREWRHEEFPAAGEYEDGSLSHVVERLMAYCALNDGHYVRCVMNTEWAAINYTFLEYKLQAVSARMPHFTQQQLEFLDRASRASDRTLLAHAKDAFGQRMPRAAAAVAPAYLAARKVYRRLR